uniref:Small ribosomal subunit protein mS33 n=1 Tax=Cacopsylla melanoneura TaxID=428564 RepID=A0A8D8TBM1_9HEMI
MSNYFKYSHIVQVSTNYAKRMSILSNRIFGEVPVPRDVKTMNRVVGRFSTTPPYKRPFIIDYYPRHVETGWLMKHLRDYGLFRDEHADFVEEMRRLRELRGKIKRLNKGGEKKSKSLI